MKPLKPSLRHVALRHAFRVLQGAVLLGLSAQGFAQAQQEPPLDSIAQRALPCTACHGQEGRATPEGYFPRIAGKPAGYLFNQLMSFRDGRRFFPAMTYLVERQQEDYFRQLAEYFASIRLPYAPPVRSTASPSALERGRTLVFDGDLPRSMPSCRSCHGEHLMGIQPATPALLGLSPDYLIAQLGAWQHGTRKALEPDCMAQIARAMSPEDTHAVTAWLASQPVPPDTTPASSFPSKPPLECGSIPPEQRASNTQVNAQ
jgi:cytochrome c553